MALNGGTYCRLPHQWPDRFYHTTADTLEKVSPQSLARSSALAATYAYFVANAGAPEVAWLAREMTYRFEIRLARKLQSARRVCPQSNVHRPRAAKRECGLVAVGAEPEVETRAPNKLPRAFCCHHRPHRRQLPSRAYLRGAGRAVRE